MDQKPETETQTEASKPRILVADDSKLVRMTATKILSAKFDLVLAEDGEQAWDKLTSDPDLQVVFTDLGMPNLDGYGLIQRIRQADNEAIRNLPVIVITGAAEEESVRRRVFEIGATDFITKPFKSTEIIARADAHASYRQDKDDLQQNVDTDILTGALNRAGFDKKLEKDVSFINRHRENLAVVMFELDDFASTYEKIGKQYAERVIKQVAATLIKAIRKEDSLARVDFATYAAVLPLAKSEGVITLTKRLCEHVRGFKLTIAGETIPISLSAGVAAAPKGASVSAKAMMQAAQEALGNARALGAGQVQFLKLDNDEGSEPQAVEPTETPEETTAAVSSDEPSKQPAISIDQLLRAIAQGDSQLTDTQANAVLQQLQPLVTLLTPEQKQRLIKGQ